MEKESLMLQPGYRFCPTEDEIVGFYLRSKVDNTLPVYAEAVVKPLDDRRGLYSDEPWNIFSKETPLNGYFYVFTKLTVKSKKRIDRTTPSGTWKGTTKSNRILSSDNISYVKKDFVYQETKKQEAGSPSKENNRGRWLMTEFSLDDEGFENYVLCRIYNKSSKGYQERIATSPFLQNKRKCSLENNEENDMSKRLREDNLTVEQPSVSVSSNAPLLDIMVDDVWFRDDVSTLSPVDDIDLGFGHAVSTLSPVDDIVLGFGHAVSTLSPVDDVNLRFGDANSTLSPVDDIDLGFGDANSTLSPVDDVNLWFGDANSTLSPVDDIDLGFGDANSTLSPVDDVNLRFGDANSTLSPVDDVDLRFGDAISAQSPVDDVDLWFGNAISTLSPDNRASEVESANSGHNNCNYSNLVMESEGRTIELLDQPGNYTATDLWSTPSEQYLQLPNMDDYNSFLW